MKQFGTSEPGAKYVDRPGAYAVLIDRDGLILIVKHRGKYFLPGGGVEYGESHVEALDREVREETGWTIRVMSELGTAGEYIDNSDKGQRVNKIGTFFLCELDGSAGTEPEEDHEPRWLTLEEFESRAAQESHVWAVRIALGQA